MTCADCPERIQKLRRCREDREDFTEKDGSAWPMYIHQGGEQYGFCPAKSTWDPQLSEMFRLLVIASETGVMLTNGGLLDQPDWWVESIAWFIPRYDHAKFTGRVKMVLGDGKNKSKDPIAKLAGSQPKGAKGGGNNR